LGLVVTDRDLIGAGVEDVGGHQHGVGEQPDPGGDLAFGVGFLLELGHPGGFAEGTGAFQQPRQRADIAYEIGLHVHLRGFDAAGDQDGEHFAGPGAQALWVVSGGHAVQVADEVQVAVAAFDCPAPDRAEVVANVGMAGWGDTGQAGHRSLLNPPPGSAPFTTKAARRGGLRVVTGMTSQPPVGGPPAAVVVTHDGNRNG
jgi:hypothetical protein